MTLGEAVRFLRSRADRRCEQPVQWSLIDVEAVRVLTAAIDPAYLKLPREVPARSEK